MLRYALLAVFLVAAASAAKDDDEETESNFKQSCYVCTSVTDPDCAETGKLDAFKKNCNADKPSGDGFTSKSKPVGCRKALQEVMGEYRVVRQCAFSGDNVEGFKRSGNEGVRSFYYQCDDEDYCNGAEASFASLASLALGLGLALLLR